MGGWQGAGIMGGATDDGGSRDSARELIHQLVGHAQDGKGKLVINPDGSWKMQGPGQFSKKSGAQTAQNSELDDLLNTLLSGTLAEDYFGYQKRGELARNLIGMHQPGLEDPRGNISHGNGSFMSAGIYSGPQPTGPQDPGFNAFREGQRRQFARDQQAKDLALQRENARLQAEQKMNLIRQFIGSGVAGAGDTTQTITGTEDSMYSNPYRHEVVPLNKTQTTVTHRSPFDLLQYFIA